MGDLSAAGPEKDCKELRGAFQGILSWKWDGRFGTALAEFGVKKKDQVRPILERYLSFTWDDSNIGSAPAPVQAINAQLGGLRPGQLLFASDPGGEAFIFGAWWPWGDGKTISIRIGASYGKLSDSERAEKVKLLKGWFGV